MKIAELYFSIQGEGKLVGMPSVFVRTSACNLRCTWCDTPYASWSPEGESFDVDTILRRVATHPTRYVVITGGEPMIASGIEELTRLLARQGYHITIETAGTVWKDVACDLASISPKLANSTPWQRDPEWAERHETARINLEVIGRLMTLPDYQLKFVVDTPEDIDEIDRLLAELGRRHQASNTGALKPSSYSVSRSEQGDPPDGTTSCTIDPAHVLLMPQGVTREELEARKPWLVDLCKERGFRYCPRLHIELYGDTRGK